MNGEWSSIADILRQELTEYGALLNFYEEQEQALFDRNADKVLQLSTQIEQQVQIMQDCRNRREHLVTTFAVAQGQSGSSTLRSLLPLFEREVQPLLVALINEVNVLIHRIRRITKHNRVLLASAVESHQQTLRALRPDAFAQTYAPNGRSRMRMVHTAPALQTAG